MDRFVIAWHGSVLITLAVYLRSWIIPEGKGGICGDG
jgi:hypothetical protein